MDFDGTPPDQATASGFAESWNRLPVGSVYTREQFIDWMEPLSVDDFADRDVLELGFGNGSLLVHVAKCGPKRLAGVELGDTLETARKNLALAGMQAPELHRADLTTVNLGSFDVVYCIGVIHHLTSPREGFDAVLRHTRPGGRFHCWVYAYEGNAVVRMLVEPLRRLAQRGPWWLVKYGLALPLAVPFFAYAKLVAGATHVWPSITKRLPLCDYSRWIARREFAFFRHVAFDQLVAHTTRYLLRATVEEWLADSRIRPGTTYLIHRNGNSWKFGGVVEDGSPASGSAIPSP